MGAMQSETTDWRRAGVTARAIVLGLGMIVVTNVWATYSEYYMKSSVVGVGIVPMSVFLPFFLLVGVVNVGLRSVAPGLALRPTELLTAFAMGLVGNAAGMVGQFLSTLASPYYGATPENQWGMFHAYLPSHLIPTNNNEAMTWFFEGLPEGEAIPWSEWMIPVFWWLCFFLAVIAGSLSIASIFRAQWVEKERLAFPLALVPLKMTDERAGMRGLGPAFLRDRLFWIGAAIPFSVIAWNCLGYFWPAFPQMNFIYGRWYRINRWFPPFYTRVNFFVIGFAYFANLDVIFSMWFFGLMGMLQTGLFNRLGITFGAITEFSYPMRLVRVQCCGAYCFLALWFVWVAREHLWSVLRNAWTGPAMAAEEKELLPSRVAIFGLLSSLAFIAVFFWKAGMHPLLLVTYLAVTFVFAFGMAKFVAESGLIYFSFPFDHQEFSIFLIGSERFAAQTMTTWTVARTMCMFNIVGFAHVGRIADAMRANKRKIAAAIVLAAVVGFLFALWLAMVKGYDLGAHNSGHWVYRRSNRWTYGTLVRKLRSPVFVDWPKIGLFIGGGVACAVLTFMRYQFSWWRLHPIGFTVGVQGPTRTAALSLIIAWLVKLVLIRLGGARLARRVEPFFLGIVCGHAIGVGLSFVIDWIWFPGEGHPVHFW